MYLSLDYGIQTRQNNSIFRSVIILIIMGQATVAVAIMTTRMEGQNCVLRLQPLCTFDLTCQISTGNVTGEDIYANINDMIAQHNVQIHNITRWCLCPFKGV